MGLLDDAIREHLDLKRRHGADPAEVERAEREALGPVRRLQSPETEGFDDGEEPPLEPGAPAAEEDEAGPAAGLAFDREDDAGYGPEDDDPYAHEDDSTFGHGEEPATGQRAGRGAFDHAAQEDDDSWSYENEPPAARSEPDPPPAPADPLDQATAVHRPAFLEDEPFADDEFEPPAPAPRPHRADPEPDSEGEELLEETPEFLQDTPDHDRLWFEQRPPKDFDFDG